MTMKNNPTNILWLLEMTSIKEAKALKQVDCLLAKQDAQADSAVEPAQLLVAVHPSKLEDFQKVACAMGLKVMVL